MLKPETLEDLENAFNFNNELGEFIPELNPAVEIVNLDLIRIHINDRIHPDTVREVIVEILRKNNEKGPLTLHAETATSCRLLFYVDIING